MLYCSEMDHLSNFQTFLSIHKVYWLSLSRIHSSFLSAASKGWHQSEYCKNHLMYYTTLVWSFSHIHTVLLCLPCCLVSSWSQGPGIWVNALRGRWSKGRRGLVSHGSCEESAWFSVPPAGNSQTVCRCSPPLADSCREDMWSWSAMWLIKDEFKTAANPK